MDLMAFPSPLEGDALLVAVTDALAALHERHYGRRPAAARSMFMDDDLLACVMGGVYTDVEKTLIELQRQPLVSEARSTFQQAMSHRLIGAVQELSDRHVESFISTHHVGPDLEVELFMLTPVP
jgi:uncharacterized protein YbcI